MAFPHYRIVVDPSADVTFVVAAVSGETTRHAAAFGESLTPERLARRDCVNRETAQYLRRAVAAGYLEDNRRTIRGTHRSVPVSPHFKRLQIETTLACNLKCAYCYCDAGPARHDTLPLDLALSAVADADRLGCIYVDLTGGEFFAYRHWRELATEVRRRGMVLTVHTNGLLLDEKKIECLLELGTHRVLVAFESHLAGIHDEIRGRSGAHYRTAENVRRAVDAGVPVHASLMVHSRNRDTIGDTLKWLIEDLGVSVALDRITAYGRENEKAGDSGSQRAAAKIGLTTPEFFEVVAPHLHRSGAITEKRVCDSGAGNISSHIAPHCGVADNFAFITANGEIALCPTMTSREESRFRGPDLSQTSLYEAWTNDPLFLSTRFLNCSNVAKCPSGSACGGGCRSNAYAETGVLDAPDYLECNIHKNPSEQYIDFAKLYQQGILTPTVPTE